MIDEALQAAQRPAWPAGVYLRADPKHTSILDGRDDRRRAELIASVFMICAAPRQLCSHRRSCRSWSHSAFCGTATLDSPRTSTAVDLGDL